MVRTPRSPLFLTLAALATAAGFALSAHHPLWPLSVAAVFALWLAVAFCRPQAWLFVLPALLPVANLSPWTGWLGFEEFDLLLLGAIAAGHWRLGLPMSPKQPPQPFASQPRFVALWAFALLSLVSFGRGLADAGIGSSASFGWFQGYVDPLNCWRVFKPAIYALALWPMTAEALRRSGARAMRRIAAGMVCGLALVALLALRERAAYPGLLDFGSRYRITAWFWEMHVGGAAIDAYLALAAPFALWALWSARSALRWSAAAALALLAAYACLTTFSRGVYLGVGLPLLLLGGWLAAQRVGMARSAWRMRAALVGGAVAVTAASLVWALAEYGFVGLGLAALAGAALLLAALWRIGARRKRFLASALLLVALLAEVVLVFSPNSFMRERVASGERDFGSRLSHWRHGIALLTTPADALFGIGIGRLPAHYARATPGREFPGAIDLPAQRAGGSGVIVRGPATQERFEGLYGLTQRVPVGGGRHRVALALKTSRALELDLFVCEMHLLYPRECEAAHVEVEADAGRWQQIDVLLSGPPLSAGPPLAPRGGLFWLSVATAGAVAEVDRLSVRTAAGTQLIDNGRFGAGLAHWFPVAVDYFVPWHIDNLALELLIERGALGLLGFVALLAGALFGVVRRPRHGCPEPPFFVASLGGVLLVGGVSSVLDTPRIAFLLLLLLLVLFANKFTLLE